jgi:hypothetical protein
MFGSTPQTPAAPAVTPTPTIDEAAEQQSNDVELKRKRGRLASILTSNQGATGTPKLGTTTLFGV